MRVPLIVLSLLWVACAAADDAHIPPAPPGEDDNGDPPGEPDDDDPPGDGVHPTGQEACYLGENGAGDTCLTTVQIDPIFASYDYPEPLQGSAQYREPIAYLDLEAYDSSKQLAPNFVLGELAQGQKGRFAIVQTHALDFLQAVRDAVGVVHVNSGYRSPGYNDQVGGATWSRHMYGDAFDIWGGSATLGELAQACEDQGAGYVAVYANHVHCDWRDDPLDPAFFGDAVASPAPLPVHETMLFERDGVWYAPAAGWDEGEPLREWTAWDASGRVLERHTGPSFEPPPEAAEVGVVVGMLLERRAWLR